MSVVKEECSSVLASLVRARCSASCDVVNGGTYALIRSAATNIRHRIIDVAVGRRFLRSQQRCRGHQLAGLAISTLRHLAFDPRVLQLPAECRRRQRLDRGDRSVADRAHWYAAASARNTVDVNGASSALCNAAPELGP